MSDDCVICLEELNYNIYELPCRHKLHRKCYLEYEAFGFDKCCLCQEPLPQDEICLFLTRMVQMINARFLNKCLIGLSMINLTGSFSMCIYVYCNGYVSDMIYYVYFVWCASLVMMTTICVILMIIG